MFNSYIYFYFKNLKFGNELSEPSFLKIKENLLLFIQRLSVFKEFELNLNVELVSEIDVFGYNKLSAEEQEDFKENYLIFRENEFKKIVFLSSNEMNSSFEYPFLRLAIEHLDELSSSQIFEIINLIDRFCLINRILTNSNLHVPGYKYRLNIKDNYSRNQYIFAHDSYMLTNENEFLKDYNLNLNDIVNHNNKFEKIVNLALEEKISFDVRKFHKAFYDFGLNLLDFNITILVILLENLIPIISKNNKEICKVFNVNKLNSEKKQREKIKIIRIFFELTQFTNTVEFAYEVRNYFSHGSVFETYNMKKFKRLFKKDLGILSDDNDIIYLKLRKELWIGYTLVDK